MAASDSLPLPHRSDAKPPADQRVAAKPGEPNKRNGQVLGIAAILMTALWLVSLVQIIRLPAQGPLQTSGEAAIWTALALASAISAFLLGIWKAHRS